MVPVLYQRLRKVTTYERATEFTWLVSGRRVAVALERRPNGHIFPMYYVCGVGRPGGVQESRKITKKIQKFEGKGKVAVKPVTRKCE